MVIVDPITFELILEAFGFFYIFPDTHGFIITVAQYIKNDFAIPSLRKSKRKWSDFLQQYYIVNNNAWRVDHWIPKSKTYFGWCGFMLILIGLCFQSQIFR